MYQSFLATFGLPLSLQPKFLSPVFAGQKRGTVSIFAQGKSAFEKKSLLFFPHLLPVVTLETCRRVVLKVPKFSRKKLMQYTRILFLEKTRGRIKKTWWDFFCFPYFVGKHSNGFSLSVLQKTESKWTMRKSRPPSPQKSCLACYCRIRLKSNLRKSHSNKKERNPTRSPADIWNKVPFHPLLVHPSSSNHPILPVCTWGPLTPPPLSLIPTNEIWRKEREGRAGKDFYPRDKNWKRDLKCHQGIPRKGAGFDKIKKQLRFSGNSLSG